MPHLHKFNKYDWEIDYYTSTNKMRLLTSANQISKSSTAIRDNIEKAGNPELWPKFFKRRQPKLFWYIYPVTDTVRSEVEQKWVGEFLPQGEYKNHPTYGWEIEYGPKKVPLYIRFNSGVTIAFRTWKQEIQSATVDMVTVDEEIPPDLYPELVFRLSATDGMFAMVFTATRSEYFWYQAMELIGKKGEKFKDAWKRSISMYDCQKYADGSESPWTLERIKQRENQCSDQHEIDRRVHGRFVMSRESLVYSQFRKERNMYNPDQFQIPKDYLWYVGIDIGSSGSNHKAAIAFIAVNQNHTKAFLAHLWRGSEEEETSNGDIINMYVHLRDMLGVNPVSISYDWAAKDFEIQATRNGIPLQKAEKSHEIGVGLINTSFKNQMLFIPDNEMGEMYVDELMALRTGARKQNAKDDCLDCVRYAYAKIPMRYDLITGAYKVEVPKAEPRIIERTNKRDTIIDEYVMDFDDEIREYNDLYEV